MENEKLLRLAQMKRRGFVISGFTHDIKNHLAVIRESSGLLEDYILMYDLPPEIIEKFTPICKKIERRVTASVEMCQTLNAWGHRTDTTTQSFNLKELILEQLFFLHRNAALKEVELSFDNDKSDGSMINQAPLIQFIFSDLFLTLLDRTEANTTISITLTKNKSDTIICLRKEGKLNDPLAISQAAQYAAEKTGSKIELVTDDSQYEELRLKVSSQS